MPQLRFSVKSLLKNKKNAGCLYENHFANFLNISSWLKNIKFIQENSIILTQRIICKSLFWLNICFN